MTNLYRGIVLLSFLFSTVLSAQAQDAANRLVELWGSAAVEELQNNGTWEYELFRQEQGCYLADMNGQKDISAYPDATQFVPVEGLEALDLSKLEQGILLAEYNLPVLPHKYGYYRVGDTGFLLVIYPEDLIEMLYARQNQ
ncbi:MAG: hypothetical protein KDC12_11140 [Flavobacteriales bacterium]|nr:hypothetical protein [Flavobacteriales bacterium]